MRTLINKIDDKLNPVLVKELRQATHGKFIRSIILGLLSVLFISMVVQLLAQSSSRGLNMHAGRDMFSWFIGVLSVITFLGVSNWTSNRFTNERDGSSMELLYASTIKPWQIITGKSLTGLIVALQLYSICLPFMTVCYLLRGIDVQAILLSTILSFVLFIPILQMAVFIGSLPIDKKRKRGLNIALIIFVFWFGGVGTVGLVFDGGLKMDIWSKDFWIWTGVLVSIVTAVSGIMFFLSVAAISAPSDNRALPIRSFLSLTWFVSAVIMSICSFVYEEEFIIIWLVFVLILTSLGMLVAASERVAYGTHVRKQIPKIWLARVVAFPHFSGVVNGMFYFFTMAIVSIIISTLIYCFAGSGDFISNLGSRSFGKGMVASIGVTLFIFAISLVSYYFKMILLKSKPVKTQAATIIALFLSLGSFILPMLLLLIIHAGDMNDLDHYPGFFILSAIGPFFKETRYIALGFDLIFAGVIGLISLPMLFRSWRNFKPYVATDKTHD